MFVIVGLFMLFSGIHSVYGGGKQQAKEAVIVKQVKVGGGPVCLSENTPLVFYDRSMDIIEVIFTSGTESKTGLLVISGNYGQVTEQFDLFNGKSIRFPAPMNPQAMRWTWLTYFMKPGFSRLVSRI